jgi:hypothetical protein
MIWSMLRFTLEVLLESRPLGQDGKKGLFSTLTLISLYLQHITVYNGITDPLILGLREFADHFAISMNGRMRKYNGVWVKIQYSMMTVMIMKLMLQSSKIQI